MGAGCLFFDVNNRVLLVKPTYKPSWEIPGGIVELNESPKQCCQREVFEEIGIRQEIGQLLVVDYNAETNTKTESLMFIFDGGTLSEADIASIRLQEGELKAYGFYDKSDLPEEMTNSLKNRVLVAWQQRIRQKCVYLENQQQI